MVWPRLFDLYSQRDPHHPPHSMRSVIRWGIVDRLAGRRRIDPPGPGAPRIAPDLELIHRQGGPPRLTWIGHSSFLVSLDGAHLLVDPVFSGRLNGLVRRHVPPGLAPHQLPPIDALLVTHSHWDHLDEPSLTHLPRSTPVFVPVGLGPWMKRRGFDTVRELDWWQGATCGHLTITLTPARHWSRRGMWDTNSSLWGGFVAEADGKALYHAGDTAWFAEGFRQIRRRFPDLLAAMLPIGVYRPGWFIGYNHMNPEEAGRAFLTLGARHLVAMHWGTYKLSDEPLAEPAERIRAWWQAETPPGRLHLPAVGETVVLET